MASCVQPVFADQAVEVEWIRGDLFRVTDPTTGTVRIFEARIMAENIANAARCYRDYRERQGATIIKFPEIPEAAHHAAALD